MWSQKISEIVFFIEKCGFWEGCWAKNRAHHVPSPLASSRVIVSIIGPLLFHYCFTVPTNFHHLLVALENGLSRNPLTNDKNHDRNHDKSSCFLLTWLSLEAPPPYSSQKKGYGSSYLRKNIEKTYIYIYIHTYIHTYIHIYIYTYIYIFIYIYIYIYTHIMYIYIYPIYISIFIPISIPWISIKAPTEISLSHLGQGPESLGAASGRSGPGCDHRKVMFNKRKWAKVSVFMIGDLKRLIYLYIYISNLYIYIYICEYIF